METCYTQRKSKSRGPHFFDLSSGSHGAYIAQPFTDFLDEDREICSVLAELVEELTLSDTALSLLEEAADFGWQVALDDLGQMDFHLDTAGRVLVLNHHGLDEAGLRASQYFTYMLGVSLIKALRAIWHEERHGDRDHHYGPESLLKLERMRTADSCVFVLLSAWELRMEDSSGLWRHIVGGEEGDMALVFSRVLERGVSSVSILQALTQSFDQWFKNEGRVNNCDHETLEYLDDVISAGSVALTKPFGQTRLDELAVEALSCLPDKTAYLHGRGGDILKGPLYAGLSDPVNQSHFMHLVHDLEVTTVQGVGFRDATLAARIFPANDRVSGVL